MHLKCWNILPLTSAQWCFICLVHGFAAFVPEKSEVKGCVVIEMSLRGQLSVWRQGGGRGTHYHIALQTSHTSPPPPHIPLHLSQRSNINLNVFFPVLCFSKLWSVCMSSAVVRFKGGPVVLWEQRGLLLFQQMLVRLKCSDCSVVFLMLSLCSGKHLNTHTGTVCCCFSQPCHQWFYCCCLTDSLH